MPEISSDDWTLTCRASNSLTYDASLTELTSLEELLRTLMIGSDPLPAEVISKLWDVYSPCFAPTILRSVG